MTSNLFVSSGSAIKIFSRFVYSGSNRLANFNPCRKNHSIESECPYQEVELDIDEKSTREKPMKVTAFGNERTIACICGDIHFMTLKKGPPVTCKCGYWLQLVDARKFWIHGELKEDQEGKDL